MERLLASAAFLVSWSYALGFVLAGAVFAVERAAPGLLPPLVRQALSMAALGLLCLPIFIDAWHGSPRDRRRAGAIAFGLVLFVLACLF